MQTKSALRKRRGSACYPARWESAHPARWLTHTYVSPVALVTHVKVFPLTKKTQTAYWSFCRCTCIYSTSATVGPSGAQKREWWSRPGCIPVPERVPSWPPPQTAPFSHSPLASSSPSVTTLGSQNYTGYHQTIFCCRCCSGKDSDMYHLPAALSSSSQAIFH